MQDLNEFLIQKAKGIPWKPKTFQVQEDDGVTLTPVEAEGLHRGIAIAPLEGTKGKYAVFHVGSGAALAEGVNRDQAFQIGAYFVLYFKDLDLSLDDPWSSVDESRIPGIAEHMQLATDSIVMGRVLPEFKSFLSASNGAAKAKPARVAKPEPKAKPARAANAEPKKKPARVTKAEPKPKPARAAKPARASKADRAVAQAARAADRKQKAQEAREARAAARKQKAQEARDARTAERAHARAQARGKTPRTKLPKLSLPKTPKRSKDLSRSAGCINYVTTTPVSVPWAEGGDKEKRLYAGPVGFRVYASKGKAAGRGYLVERVSGGKSAEVSAFASGGQGLLNHAAFQALKIVFAGSRSVKAVNNAPQLHVSWREGKKDEFHAELKEVTGQFGGLRVERLGPKQYAWTILDTQGNERISSGTPEESRSRAKAVAVQHLVKAIFDVNNSSVQWPGERLSARQAAGRG